ncbi:MAG: bile acid:sodium symporter [Micropruina sp.]|nr:bile acid:sodium symporter [Micropruina sp.]
MDWLERHQVSLYLAGLAGGALAGLAVPGIAGPAAAAINPVLGLLLYATFLSVPFAGIGRALRDWRFLVTILAVNFVVVPPVVFLVSRFVAHDRVLLAGVLFVLLTPCVDYVIAFAGLAGGARENLLAATPLLMLVQLVLLPAYLWLFLGDDLVRTIEPGPFAEAFGLLVLLPLAAAWLTQAAAARDRRAAAFRDGVTGAMVPLMVLTLATVVASQIAAVGGRFGALLLTVPVYLAFAALMVPVGAFSGRLARLDVPGRRAVVFSGVTRNSLVVLPLVLALPAAYALAPLVVVTQTLVELVLMVVLVRLVPRIVRES